MVSRPDRKALSLSNSDLVPDDFSGLTRLFPLPDLVMFPHVVQPLRVFEPRYVEMFEAALADDHLISMAVLESGWESEYAMEPPIHPVCCLGRIISHDKQPDGTYNFLLAGVQRVRVLQEHETESPFRSADVELIEDIYQSIPSELDRSLQEEILVAFRSLTPDGGVAHESLEKLIEEQGAATWQRTRVLLYFSDGFYGLPYGNGQQQSPMGFGLPR